MCPEAAIANYLPTIMTNEEQKGRTPSSEAAEKERLLKHEEAVKALGKPIYDEMKVSVLEVPSAHLTGVVNYQGYDGK
ncbi:unnamed protein product [Litomosoides sigmodontis]|uniref:Uncharacterized protein n=1 Tax=Litomosoides sigmodontis TaxID=42156 RepID=A0A3P6U176_LITSI|nr:unnamed protein product [Litomosoides sigmodontis]